MSGSGRWLTSEKQELAFFIGFPVFAFAVLSALIGFVYTHRVIFAWAPMVPFVLLGLWCLLPFSGSLRRPSILMQQAFGAALLFACIAAVVFGMAIYGTYMRRYNIYDNSTAYENVRADEPPGAYKDGGIFNFDTMTTVDVSRSVGLEMGDRYCAAPMLATLEQDVVGFVAVGKNCCKERGKFECGKGAALSAVSLPRAGHPELSYYESAAKMIGAVYDLDESADMLVLYVDEGPQEWIDSIWYDGFRVYVVSALAMCAALPVISIGILKALQGYQKYGHGLGVAGPELPSKPLRGGQSLTS